MSEIIQTTGGQESPRPSVVSGLSVVFCTFPDQETARRISKDLITDGLAACVNLIPAIESIYRWDGKIEQSTEVLAMFKVVSSGFKKLETALLEKHPYDTPEIIGIAADQVSKNYLKWVLAIE